MMKLWSIVVGAFILSPLPASVLENEDFFQRNDSDQPTGWQIRYSIPEMETKKLVVASDGVLTLGGTELRGELLLIQPNIKLEPMTCYQVSWEERGVDGNGNLRIYLQYQKPKDGKAEQLTVNGAWNKVLPQWTARKFVFDFPENGRSPWFVINTSGVIPIQIRNLKLKAVEQTEEK